MADATRAVVLAASLLVAALCSCDKKPAGSAEPSPQKPPATEEPRATDDPRETEEPRAADEPPEPRPPTPKGWSRYSNQELGFEIDGPATPVQKEIPTRSGAATTHFKFTKDDAPRALTVTVAAKGLGDIDDGKAAVRRTVDTMIAAMKATQLQSKELSPSNGIGLSYSFAAVHEKHGSMSGWGTVLMLQDRMYVVTSMCPNQDGPAALAESETFVRSFALVP